MKFYFHIYIYTNVTHTDLSPWAHKRAHTLVSVWLAAVLLNAVVLLSAPLVAAGSEGVGGEGGEGAQSSHAFNQGDGRPFIL